jgi:hypothetical protein
LGRSRFFVLGRYDNEQIDFLALHGLRWSEAVVITSEDIRDGFVYVQNQFTVLANQKVV